MGGLPRSPPPEKQAQREGTPATLQEGDDKTPSKHEPSGSAGTREAEDDAMLSAKELRMLQLMKSSFQASFDDIKVHLDKVDSRISKIESRRSSRTTSAIGLQGTDTKLSQARQTQLGDSIEEDIVHVERSITNLNNPPVSTEQEQLIHHPSPLRAAAARLPAVLTDDHQRSQPHDHHHQDDVANQTSRNQNFAHHDNGQYQSGSEARAPVHQEVPPQRMHDMQPVAANQIQLVLPPEFLSTFRDNSEVKLNTKDLPCFEGFNKGEGIDQWCREIDIFLKSHRVNSEKICSLIGVLLKGDAKTWWTGLTDSELAYLGVNWSRWKEKLQSTFKSARTETILHQAMMHCVLMRDEDVRKYFNDKKSLIQRTLNNVSDGQVGTMILGGVPSRWRAGIRWSPVENTLDDLYHAMEIQAPQLTSCWWDEEADWRDGNGRPLPALYSKIQNLGECVSAVTPARQSTSSTSSGTAYYTSDQRRQGDRSQRPQSNYRRETSTDPEDPANKAWAEGQRRFLGRDPQKPFPPPSACTLCTDKGSPPSKGRHWYKDCKNFDDRERSRGQEQRNSSTSNANQTPQGNFRRYPQNSDENTKPESTKD